MFIEIITSEDRSSKFYLLDVQCNSNDNPPTYLINLANWYLQKCVAIMILPHSWLLRLHNFQTI